MAAQQTEMPLQTAEVLSLPFSQAGADSRWELEEIIWKRASKLWLLNRQRHSEMIFWVVKNRSAHILKLLKTMSEPKGPN